ncbi:uncharacterized protein LOC133890338 [Phragmites australis]|uniref:uncharacterized protein LOC133890338 n=1 Tax=Phragmites australis TaxID=29695 RepID=UPI002D7869B3|nr:uncharacterized protein LOC133890338 [Phragmites australis]
MTQLHKVIGDLALLVVCTDSCKGLENAVKHIFPNAEQRECFRHLMENFIKRYSGGEHMFPAARAYKKEVFEQHMSTVLSSNPDVFQWIKNWHSLKWMRCAFNPVIKCDYVTNNVDESSNNWIRDIKDLLVIELANKLREMIMVLWHKRRRIGERLIRKILPVVLHVLKARTRGLDHLSVVKGDNYVVEVWDNSNCHAKHVVKAYLHECSCEEWQHTGKPC